jgi:organic radical activating enzyme
MLKGERPSNCGYCWNAEDDGQLSDRVIKTKNVNKELFNQWNGIKVDPRMLEIAFDRTCNLACAYCGPSFSSKWANDIKRNGPYLELKTDSRYSTDSSKEILDENNPYIDAFFAWWPTLKTNLKVLRITGGEPLMSHNFWRFLDQLDGFKGQLIINTNLICHKDEIERLITKTKKIKLRIHTSMESSLDQAEYIRDGFDQTVWLANIAKLMDNRRIKLNVTTSINNIAVWSFIDYLKVMKELKNKWGSDRIEINCNFVHYPVFMRIQMIPLELRLPVAQEVTDWTNSNKRIFSDDEQNHIKRFVDTLTNSPCSMNDPHYHLEDAYKDLKNFIQQYDMRRNKDYKKLDKRFVEWYNDLVL